MKAVSGRRLCLEWKNWSRNHPSGIKAQPIHNPNGTLNLRHWECMIPGPMSSPWEGGRYKLIMSFPDNFPVIPPVCRFDPPIFHPNVFPSGLIFLPELCENMFWRSDSTIEMILMHVQEMLINPNVFEAADVEAKSMYLMNFHEYERLARTYAKSMGAGGEASN